MKDMYMELTGGPTQIQGETADYDFRTAKKKRPMEIDYFRLNGNWSPDSGGNDEKKLNPFTPAYTNTKLTLSVTKRMDSASPTLFLAYCHNFRVDKKYEFFQSAVITCRKSRGDGVLAAFLILEFKEVYLMEFSWDETAGDDKEPTEELLFRFGTCKMTYLRQDKEGVLSAGDKAGNIKGWNFRTNVPM